MPDNQPLVTLDSAGTPTTVSYSMPDTVSYAGRHYLELDLASTDFLPEAGEVQAEAGDLVRTRVTEARIESAADVRLRSVVAEGGPSIVQGSEGELSAAQALSFRRSGLFVEVPPAMAPRLRRGPSQENLESATTGSDRIVELDVSIRHPADGARLAAVAGSSVAVRLDGVAVFRGVIAGQRNVQYRIDDGPWQRAVADNSLWTRWHADVALGPGSHLIAARAAADETYGVENQIAVDVQTATSPTAGADDTPPTLVVESPVSGSTILTGGRAEYAVRFSGRATDPGGVTQVRVVPDGDESRAVTAQPLAPSTDLTRWQAAVPLPLGPHRTRIIATDNAANSQEVRVDVRLERRGRRLSARCVLVEIYRLSSFLGRYGAGRILKTFSLLPGEQHVVTVKSYARTTDRARETQSILDSVGTTATTEFANDLASEQTNKQTYDETFKWSAEARAEAAWGWGKAAITGQVSGSSNSAREQFGKSVLNAVEKHANSVSSKRDVQVNAEHERTVEQGFENSSERRIQNINVGRTLNFVFRQMNQEYVTVLHLVDARVAIIKEFESGDPLNPDLDYTEASLGELDSLLDRHVVGSRHAYVRTKLLEMLQQVRNHEDRLESLVEEVALQRSDGSGAGRYWRIRPRLLTTITETESGLMVQVRGVVVRMTRVVLRTDGVFVEALLGQGEALDSYSRGLQDASVQERQLQNGRVRTEIEDRDLRRQIIADNDTARAELYATLHPAPVPASAPAAPGTTTPS